MKLLFASIATTCLIMAAAECPNACSGNGFCSNRLDYCECNRNWMGNDCSQRRAPYGVSWVDSPQGDLNYDGSLSGAVTFSTTDGSNTAEFRLWESHPQGLYGIRDTTTHVLTGSALATLSKGVRENEGHFYSECSNKGVPDRATGTCQCFAGFEGQACQRASCPNSCSGHGSCRTSNEVLTSHTNWDAAKEQQCSCDAGYSGADCSSRLCPKGNDPLGATGLVNEVQKLSIECNADDVSGSIRITYTDLFGEAFTSAPITIQANAAYTTEALRAAVITDALVALPNDVIASATAVTALKGTHGTDWDITFTSNPGNLNAITVDDSGLTCTGKAVVISEVTPGTTGSTECSTRGLCDYDTGLCSCFRGYTGDDCSQQNALAGSVSETL